MVLLTYKYEPFWQEVGVKPLILRWPLRPMDLLFLSILFFLFQVLIYSNLFQIYNNHLLSCTDWYYYVSETRINIVVDAQSVKMHCKMMGFFYQKLLYIIIIMFIINLLSFLSNWIFSHLFAFLSMWITYRIRWTPSPNYADHTFVTGLKSFITMYTFLFRQSLTHLFTYSFFHKFIHPDLLYYVRMAFVCCQFVVFWTVLSELGKLNIFRSNWRGFRELFWCTHVYERVFKCVHELISGNFTKLG